MAMRPILVALGVLVLAVLGLGSQPSTAGVPLPTTIPPTPDPPATCWTAATADASRIGDDTYGTGVGKGSCSSATMQIGVGVYIESSVGGANSNFDSCNWCSEEDARTSLDIQNIPVLVCCYVEAHATFVGYSAGSPGAADTDCA